MVSEFSVPMRFVPSTPPLPESTAHYYINQHTHPISPYLGAAFIHSVYGFTEVDNRLHAQLMPGLISDSRTDVFVFYCRLVTYYIVPYCSEIGSQALLTNQRTDAEQLSLGLSPSPLFDINSQYPESSRHFEQ